MYSYCDSSTRNKYLRLDTQIKNINSNRNKLFLQDSC